MRNQASVIFDVFNIVLRGCVDGITAIIDKGVEHHGSEEEMRFIAMEWIKVN